MKLKKEDLYKDYKGYYRFKNTGKLVHRWVAYKYIYLKDRKKYPLDFKEYQVHHINKNITDNKKENLEVISIREHELNHNIHRHEYPMIKTSVVFIVMFLLWFSYLNYVSKYQLTIKDAIFMSSTLIIGIIFMYFINKKKKGRRYV